MVGFKCSTHYWACTWIEPSDINTYLIWCQETDQTSITLPYYSYDPLIWAQGCCASDEVKLEFNFHLWPVLEQPVVSSLVFSPHWDLSSLLLLVPSCLSLLLAKLRVSSLLILATLLITFIFFRSVLIFPNKIKPSFYNIWLPNITCPYETQDAFISIMKRVVMAVSSKKWKISSQCPNESQG